MIGLIVLTTLGLSAFGVATSTLYRRSLLDQLDNQLLDASRPVAGQLQRLAQAGLGSTSCERDTTPLLPGTNPPGGQDTFAPRQDLDVEARLYRDTEQIACLAAVSSTGHPKIPGNLTSTRHTKWVTVQSAQGGGSWRVLATPLRVPGPNRPQATSDVVVVARPTASLEEALQRLHRIEIATGLGLLLMLAGGAWLVLRRGLQPLERMASSAGMITAGNLSHRVNPADQVTEVGQLGLALNTMLDGIEQAFREREATEQRLRQFLADASHELRTPITSIQGFAELFRLNNEQSSDDLAVIMRRIEAESARMRTLVEDLLLLARLDQTRPLSREHVDLSVLAADACTDAMAIEPDRPITLDAPSPIIVTGDADHLRQAITNLVTNARTHTPSGTPIEVATSVDDNQATVRVRDHGHGLDAAGLAHAFDRFWQADAARVGSGAGLGLAIVAGIAAEHRGSVSVENLDDGGACFTLRLVTTTPTEGFSSKLQDPTG